jgi:hypothetical protein
MASRQRSGRFWDIPASRGMMNPIGWRTQLEKVIEGARYISAANRARRISEAAKAKQNKEEQCSNYYGY